MVKKPITVKLSKEHIDVLHQIGGNTKGITTLIERHLGADGNKNSPEKEMFDMIYLPADMDLRATYIAVLNAYIMRGNLAGTLGFYLNTISGIGFSDATTRVHFKKLEGSGFLMAVPPMMFRPTLRLREETTKKAFKTVLETYSLFIQGTANFTDFWCAETGSVANERDLILSNE